MRWGRGSVLLSSWNGRDRAVLPGSVPHVQQAGDVGRGRGSLSSRFLLSFIFFLLPSRFWFSSRPFCFTSLSPRSCFSVIPVDCVWWRWRERWAHNRVRYEGFRKIDTASSFFIVRGDTYNIRPRYEFCAICLRDVTVLPRSH